jgi:hypothetical protein
MEEPGKADTPRTRALNTNHPDLAMRHEPPKQRFETSMVRWERLDPQHTTIGIHHSRYMLIGMSIHTTNNHPYH